MKFAGPTCVDEARRIADVAGVQVGKTGRKLMLERLKSPQRFARFGEFLRIN